MPLNTKNGTKRKRENKKATPKPKCRSCGVARTGIGKIKLRKTECCGHWICDDEFFSFGLTSCSRNHRRYSLCAYHVSKNHQGTWQDCKECKDESETGKFTSDKLEDPENVSEDAEKKNSIPCANCDFASYRKETFPLETSNGYYCAKDKCRKVGRAYKKDEEIQDSELENEPFEVKKAKKKKLVNNKKPIRKPKPQCRLCGSANNTRSRGPEYSFRRRIKLKKTECCDNWICDDERYYIPFAYNSSCARNHRRYSLCAFHFTESHPGRWQDCQECRDNGGGDYEFEEISCLNCGFASEAIDDFPLKTLDGYYCTKEECQNAAEDPSFSCVNCDSTYDSMSSFRKTSNGLYCYSEKCYEAGKNIKKGNSVTCVNCGFASDAKDAFPLKTSNGYYCSKEECQKAGKNQEKKDYYSCANCGFASYSMGTFPLKTSNGYYCSKEKCQKAGVTPNKDEMNQEEELAKMSLAGKKATKGKRGKKTIEKPKCGLCGSVNNTRSRGSGYSDRKKIKLTKTKCCNNLICNDERYYHPFGFCSITSCFRNHRNTLCSFHFTKKHHGRWQDCKKCKDEFSTHDYIAYSTGSFNFEKLEDPTKNLENPDKKNSFSCVNCDFASDTVDTFPLKTSNGYYCSKKECQKAGKNPEKKSISCVNCGFALDAIDTFPLKTANGYYCSKEECQKTGKGSEEKMSISCVNCGFTSDAIDAFPLKISNGGYYCTKEECQKAGADHNKDKKIQDKELAKSLEGETATKKKCVKEKATPKEEGKKVGKGPEKNKSVSCVNCGFASYAIFFPLKTSNGYYCSKVECRKLGKIMKK